MRFIEDIVVIDLQVDFIKKSWEDWKFYYITFKKKSESAD
jgi:hypothetical protein